MFRLRKFFYIFCSLVGLTASLKCWFCVGPDCGGSMESSKFAYTKTCDPGAVCQKTIYYVNDIYLNVTNVTVPIRSCSWNYGCTPMDEFLSVNTSYCDYDWRTQNGCQKRWCCDTDLCNRSGRRRISIVLPIASLSLAVMSMMKISN